MKTKQILKKLDIDGKLPTKEGIDIFFVEIRENYQRSLTFIKLNCPDKKTYGHFLDLNFTDHRIQAVVSYITYFEYKKPGILSFDNLVGLYNLLEIYDKKLTFDLKLYIKRRAKTVKHIMLIYNLSYNNETKNQLWKDAESIAKNYYDYKEMYEQTEEGSFHNLKVFNLLNLSANTVDEKNYILGEKSIIRNYQRQLIN